jgi:16S rRNA (uracil1498-N3)-methyltransferase
VAERAQAFRAGAARMARLSRVGQEAAKQCESVRWPQVSGPIPLEEALATTARHRLFLDLEGEVFPRTLTSSSVAVAVGPEGGWTPRERAAARTHGWVSVRLAAGKLRAETAAIAAMVLACEAIERGSR